MLYVKLDVAVLKGLSETMVRVFPLINARVILMERVIKAVTSLRRTVTRGRYCQNDEITLLLTTIKICMMMIFMILPDD